MKQVLNPGSLKKKKTKNGGRKHPPKIKEKLKINADFWKKSMYLNICQFLAWYAQACRKLE